MAPRRGGSGSRPEATDRRICAREARRVRSLRRNDRSHRSSSSRVLALASQEDASLAGMADLVLMDPSFAAELLRFANSPLFGVRGEIRSVVQAVLLVGLDRVKTMATVVAVNCMIRSSVRLPALRKVWLHSLATARIMEEIGRVTNVTREGGYTLGLLHNLGTLGLMSAYPDWKYPTTSASTCSRPSGICLRSTTAPRARVWRMTGGSRTRWVQ